MENVFHFIKENSEIIVLYSAVISIIAFVTLMIQGAKLSKLKKRYDRLSHNVEGKNIEEIIHQYYDKIDKLDIRMNNMDATVEKIEGKLLHSIQKVGIVQYNAFDNIGGGLSFSIALLDEQDNGFIMTSIYSRSSNAVYGKPIKKGKSSHTLSVEELQALDRAKHNSLDQYIKAAL